MLLPSDWTDFKISTLWLVILFICLRPRKSHQRFLYSKLEFQTIQSSRIICLKKRPILRAYVKMWFFICFFSFSLLFYIRYLFLLLVGASLHEKCPFLRDRGACGLRCGGRTFKLDSWCMQSSGIFV